MSMIYVLSMVYGDTAEVLSVSEDVALLKRACIVHNEACNDILSAWAEETLFGQERFINYVNVDEEAGQESEAYYLIEAVSYLLPQK